MRLRVALSCAAALALLPPPAAAQGRGSFVKGLLELTAALEGASGGEGPRIVALLESMSGALADWDRDLERQEAQIAGAIDRLAPPDAARALTALGLAYLERGRTADGVERLVRASAIEPRLPTPLLLRGLAQLGHDPPAALQAFRRARELDSTDPVSAYWLVQAAHDAGVRDGVAQAIETLLTAYERLAGRALSDIRRPFPALALVADDAVIPVFALSRYGDGYAHIGRREYDLALAALRDAARGDPLVADAALRTGPAERGTAALAGGHAAAGVADLERAAAAAPSSSEAHRILGVAYRALGRFDRSLASVQTAIALDRHNERAHLELVSILQDTGDHARARDAVRTAVDALPASGALRWMNAVHYRRVDNEAEMLRQLEAVPIDAVLAGRGQVLGVIGRLRVGALRATAAIPPFREAVLINPNNAFAQMELAELYRTEGHPEPALAGFVAALLIAPGSIDAHTGIGQVHLTTGREDDAVTAFRRAVALKPDYPDAQYGLASALLRLGRAGDAATPLHAFRSLASRRAAAARASFELFALKRKATIHADEGRYDEAVDAWQAVVAREPANPENHLELGEALVAAGGIATAIDTLEHAMTLGAPADVLRRLAELYAAEGRDEASARARAEYERWQTEALRARFKRH